MNTSRARCAVLSLLETLRRKLVNNDCNLRRYKSLILLKLLHETGARTHVERYATFPEALLKCTAQTSSAVPSPPRCLLWSCRLLSCRLTASKKSKPEMSICHKALLITGSQLHRARRPALRYSRSCKCTDDYHTSSLSDPTECLQLLPEANLRYVLGLLPLSERIRSAELVSKQWRKALRDQEALSVLDFAADPVWKRQVTLQIMCGMLALHITHTQSLHGNMKPG